MATYIVARLGTWNGEDTWYRDTDPHESIGPAEREAQGRSQAGGVFEVWRETESGPTVESRWHRGRQVPHA